ncbi:ankyrin repeat protein [Pelomyxa schiedti]|nr:ankyrin repeat protein [Pelomyxa schiedti]
MVEHCEALALCGSAVGSASSSCVKDLHREALRMRDLLDSAHSKKTGNKVSLQRVSADDEAWNLVDDFVSRAVKCLELLRAKKERSESRLILERAEVRELVARTNALKTAALRFVHHTIPCSASTATGKHNSFQLSSSTNSNPPPLPPRGPGSGAQSITTRTSTGRPPQLMPACSSSPPGGNFPSQIQASSACAVMKAKEFEASAQQLGFDPTPLQLAVLYGNDLQARALLDSGSDPNETDKRGWTALHYAASFNRSTILKLLITGYKGNLDVQNGERLLPVHEAARNGSLEALQTFLECGFPNYLTAFSGDKYQPLHYAVMEGRLNVIRFLQNFGYSEKAPKTPLHLAATRNEAHSAQELIHKFPVDTRDTLGVTPLMEAAIQGNTEITKLLLSKDADATTVDLAGKTPLHYAAAGGNIATVNALLDTGKVNVEAEDKDGRTPVAHAVLHNNGDMVRHLVNSKRVNPSHIDKDGNTPLTLAAAVGCTHATSALLECNVSANETTQDGVPALLVALDSEFPDVAGLLLKSGAQVNVSNSVGLTPLHLASQKGYSFLTKELIKMGAVVDAKDPCGRTALHYAIISNPDCVAILKRAGATLYTKTDSGVTPINERLSVEAEKSIQVDNFMENIKASFITRVSDAEIGAISAGTSFADGPGLTSPIPQKTLQSFTIFARDSNSNFCKECNANVTVTFTNGTPLTNPSVGANCIASCSTSATKTYDSFFNPSVMHMSLQACGDGTWAVSYKLEIGGTFSIGVYVNNQHIADSPYTVSAINRVQLNPPCVTRVIEPPPSRLPETTTQWLRSRGVGCVDIALACDATYSMDSAIDVCKHRMLDVIAAVQGDNAGLVDVVRLALCFYRDHPPQDRTFVTRQWDFTEDHRGIQSQIMSMNAIGGGDYPEALEDALHVLNDMSWNPHAIKVAVVIGDAPPHGVGDEKDAFPEGCPCGYDFMIEAERLKNRGVTVNTVMVASGEPSLAYSFSALASTTGGRCLRIEDSISLVQCIKCQVEAALDFRILQEKITDIVVTDAATTQKPGATSRLSFSQRAEWLSQKLAQEHFTVRKIRIGGGGVLDLTPSSVTSADVTTALFSLRQHAHQLSVLSSRSTATPQVPTVRLEDTARYEFVTRYVGLDK